MNYNPIKSMPTLKTFLFSAPFLINAFIGVVVFSGSAWSQSNELSLADILVALRSKKATLNERNKLLTEAVNVRGITFVMGPEIEKELSTTGADNSLLQTIRQKNSPVEQVASVSRSNQSETSVQPKSTIPENALSDYSYYEKQGSEEIVKGETDAAMGDFTKAIELNGKATVSLLGRGRIYKDRKAYTLAIADYTKVLETDPKNVSALMLRAEIYEEKGDRDLAITDLKSVMAIEPANVPASERLGRLQPKPVAEKKSEALAVKVPEPVVPEFVDLGNLSESEAPRIVTPVYPAIAAKLRLAGKITVNVTIDEEGNVVSAEATSGPGLLKHASEDAAKRSKFKPSKVGDRPVKAKGYIVYGFSPGA